MKINGIEKVSFVDYEGKICATIFTGGCNFRCPFCHNSSIVNQTSKEYSEEEILSYLKDRKSLLDALTISGGEPTLQKDLAEFSQKVKDLGYQIKLDTNGTMPEVVKNLVKKNLVDYVAIDIKNSFCNYLAISGIANPNIEKIKETLSILKKEKIPYELRTTLVKGFHTKQTIQQMAEDLSGENILYLQKFVDSGSCLQSNLTEIDKQTAREFQSILSKTIKNVELRGY